MPCTADREKMPHKTRKWRVSMGIVDLKLLTLKLGALTVIYRIIYHFTKIYYLTIVNKIKKCSIIFYMLINLASAMGVMKFIINKAE